MTGTFLSSSCSNFNLKFTGTGFNCNGTRATFFSAIKFVVGMGIIGLKVYIECLQCTMFGVVEVFVGTLKWAPMRTNMHILTYICILLGV